MKQGNPRQTLMNKLGLTLRDISEATGINQSMASAVISGRYVDPERLAVIDRFLEVIREERIAELTKEVSALGAA